MNITLNGLKLLENGEIFLPRKLQALMQWYRTAAKLQVVIVLVNKKCKLEALI